MEQNPGVDSASNRNEYQESSWGGVKSGQRVTVTSSPPSFSSLFRKYGSLDVSQLSGPPRPLNRDSFTFFSPSRKCNNCTDTQNMPSTLCNPNVPYRVHKRLSLICIMNHISSVCTLRFQFVTTVLMLSFCLCIVLQSGLFPSRFLTRTLNFLLSHDFFMCCPSYHPRFVHHCEIWREI
jgi:hypothetical protein